MAEMRSELAEGTDQQNTDQNSVPATTDKAQLVVQSCSTAAVQVPITQSMMMTVTTVPTQPQPPFCFL